MFAGGGRCWPISPIGQRGQPVPSRSYWRARVSRDVAGFVDKRPPGLSIAPHGASTAAIPQRSRLGWSAFNSVEFDGIRWRARAPAVEVVCCWG